MNFNELTRARYSLRKFDSRPIEEEKLRLLLQAADLGLGSTYVGVFDPEKLALALPELAGRTPIALLPVGYPAPDAHPSKLHTQRKPLEEFYTEL